MLGGSALGGSVLHRFMLGQSALGHSVLGAFRARGASGAAWRHRSDIGRALRTIHTRAAPHLLNKESEPQCLEHKTVEHSFCLRGYPWGGYAAPVSSQPTQQARRQRP